MKKYLKVIIAALVVLVFIGTFVFLYQKSKPQPVVYDEFTPKVADISKTTVITGAIEPRDEVEVKPQISGIITEIYKEAGQMVKAGEVIAKVKVIPDMGQLSSAESRVRLAEINLKQAKVNYDREKQLYDKQLVSAEEYDNVRQALDQAREEKTAAIDALEVVRDGVSSSNASASSTAATLPERMAASPSSSYSCLRFWMSSTESASAGESLPSSEETCPFRFSSTPKSVLEISSSSIRCSDGVSSS